MLLIENVAVKDIERPYSAISIANHIAIFRLKGVFLIKMYLCSSAVYLLSDDKDILTL